MVEATSGTKWQSVKIEQLVANTKHALAMGPFGSRITKDNFVDVGVPVIRGTNLSYGRFDHKDLVFLTEEKANELRASNAFPDDLVFTHRGTLGQVGIVPRGNYPRYVVSQSQMKLTCDQTKVLPLFLYYYFRSDLGLHELLSHTGGSGVPAISSPLTTLRNAIVRLPPLPIQRKIAAILSAYDDLIENNTRRIAILEEMAQSLYREWFVHFRFPGHEKKRMVESALGMIPEGWEIKVIGELLKTQIGGGWGQEEKNEDFSQAAYVIRGTDIPLARYVLTDKSPLRYHKISNLEPRQLQTQDIVFEVSGGSKGQPVGRALFVSQQLLDSFDEAVICASFCKLLRVDKEIILPELFYLHLLEIYENGRIEKYQVQSTGIINFKFMLFSRSELVVIPNQIWQEKFREIVIPLFASIQTLGVKNANLRRMRDLLLPKLISGEVDVEGLEIAGAEEIGEVETKAVEV